MAQARARHLGRDVAKDQAQMAAVFRYALRSISACPDPEACLLRGVAATGA